MLRTSPLCSSPIAAVDGHNPGCRSPTGQNPQVSLCRCGAAPPRRALARPRGAPSRETSSSGGRSDSSSLSIDEVMTMDKSDKTRRHFKSLRDFLNALRDLNDMREVRREVDTDLEIGAIIRRTHETY